ncbi:MAG: hypothetical protein R2706_12195 [Acidimicrobiales bacterium]
MFTAIFTVSAVTGPIWGGLLVDMAQAGAGCFGRCCQSAPPPSSSRTVACGCRSRLTRVIDWPGIAWLVIASTALILVPVWGGDTYAWSSWPILACASVGVLGTVAFVLQERRAIEPIIPLRLFRDRTVALIMVMGFLLMGALVAISTFLPSSFKWRPAHQPREADYCSLMRSISASAWRLAIGAVILSNLAATTKWLPLACLR